MPTGSLIAAFRSSLLKSLRIRADTRAYSRREKRSADLRERVFAELEAVAFSDPGELLNWASTPTIKRELTRRCAIEPVIGHAKSDRLLERNRLAGAKGDAINAILVGAGHNIRLFLAWLRVFLPLLLAFAASALSMRKSVAAIAPNAV